MSEQAEELLRRIEAIDEAAADNQRRAESYQRMSDELKTVEATVASPDGIVTVVAAAGGEIKSVTFTDRVRTASPEALSAVVTHTLAAARASAARLQAEVVRRGLGDTALLDKVLTSDGELFGDRRPHDPGPPPAPVRRRAAAQEDEFFEEFDVFGRSR
ncbi:YbaB/EbfC family nucleoid-associated protein [Amycolatopsis pigmentata]|uniref:YbaB/EbfC family nucleoid-associated protein n=1 Tax=Amycolatopsis pigmentata TaxID=450801 RepID=A0ABW5G1W2_9PSEU